MLEIINQGGPVMWVLLAVSVIATLVFLERFFHLHRAQIHSGDFLDGLYNVLRRGNVVEAVTLCEDVPGPVAQIVRSAILKADEDPDVIAKSIKECGLAEIPRLEHNLSLLASLGRILPMIGFIGTLLALFGILGDLGPVREGLESGTLFIKLRHALITSIFGIAAAVPVTVGYNFLVSRIERIILDMENAAGDILTFLATRRSD